MVNIYGVKMVDLNDILQHAGRPLMCNYIMKNVDEILDMMYDDEIIEIDTSLQGNFPVYNITKAYRLLFIPIELVEEKLIYVNIVKTLNNVKKNFMTLDRIDKVEKMILRYEEAYEKIRNKFAGEKIMGSSCFMLIYDGDKLENVYTAVPRVVVKNVIMGKQTYECSECGKIVEVHNNEYESFVPDMYYVKEDNEIKYYCPTCKDKYENSKHVGE